ncbi:hypothetical protein F5Y06DRAFT_303459 [Hypoxylon sp. FL0890]|nr:hypothetical protein F5Y06DRAFT_303459 [Hypoxylon sp. FL0890]
MFTRQGHPSGVQFPRITDIEYIGAITAYPSVASAAPKSTRQSIGTRVAACMGGLGRQIPGFHAEYTCEPQARSGYALCSYLARSTPTALGQPLEGQTANKFYTTTKPTRFLFIRGEIAEDVVQSVKIGFDKVLELVGATPLLEFSRVHCTKGHHLYDGDSRRLVGDGEVHSNERPTKSCTIMRIRRGSDYFMTQPWEEFIRDIQDGSVKISPPFLQKLPENGILIKVQCSSLNPADYKLPELAIVVHAIFPTAASPCLDNSGVAQTGGTVNGFRAGEKVRGRVGLKRYGTLGDYLCTPADECATIPEGMSLEDARVNTTEVLKAKGQVFQLVLDTVDSEPVNLYKAADHFLLPRGKFVHIGGKMTLSGPKTTVSRQLLPFFIGGGERRWNFLLSRIPRHEHLEQIGKWLKEGRVKATIDEVLQYEDVAKAIEKPKKRLTKGKIVVESCT